MNMICVSNTTLINMCWFSSGYSPKSHIE